MPPPRRPRRSPVSAEKQRDSVRTRRLILEAAAAEFAEHGYAGARVSAIASRAGVNQQLISYYFDGKQGLYQAMAQQWQQRRAEIAPPGTPLPEQLRRYALEALRNPSGPRLVAWSGLQYTGPDGDPDRASRAGMFTESLDELAALQRAGRLPAELDPRCLLVMLMAAAMAPTTLPQIIETLGGDPRSPEFIEHFAEQVALVAALLGLGADPSDAPTRHGA